MSTFNKREETAEKQFAHDEALRFKALSRRDRMAGLWAAQKLGKTGADAEAYAAALVAAELRHDSDNAVFHKIRKDFDAAGVAQSDHQIRRELEELMAKATNEVKASG